MSYRMNVCLFVKIEIDLQKVLHKNKQHRKVPTCIDKEKETDLKYIIL